MLSAWIFRREIFFLSSYRARAFRKKLFARRSHSAIRQEKEGRTREKDYRQNCKTGYSDLTPAFRIPFFKRDIKSSGEDPRPDVTSRGRENLQSPRGESRGDGVPFASGKFPLKDSQGPPGGGRDECRRMCRPQGRRNLIHCPSFPVSLAPFRCLSLPPALIPLLPLSFSLPRSLFAADLLLCSPLPSTLGGTPSLLCGWLPCRAFSINCQVITVGERALKAHCEPERISLCDDRIAWTFSKDVTLPEL